MAELDVDNDSEEYKLEAIWNCAIYVRESESGHLSSFYYLVSWKGYPEEENTWEPASTMQHLRKLISLFYKNHLKKPITTFPSINTVLPMARPTTRPTKSLKEKQERPTRHTKKCAKWGNKVEMIRRNLSQYGFKARTRQVAKNLSSCCRECRGAWSNSLIIGSLNPKKLHNTLFWSSPLLSKFLLEQTPPLSINLFLPCP